MKHSYTLTNVIEKGMCITKTVKLQNPSHWFNNDKAYNCI